MTQPRHHPDDSTLLCYAAGTLDAAFSLIVNSHLQFCEHCRNEVRHLEALGGALFETMPVPEAGEAFEARVMAAFAAALSNEGNAKQSALPMKADPGTDQLMPAPMAQAIDLSRPTIPWREVASGLSQCNVSDAGLSVTFFRVDDKARLVVPMPGPRIALMLWGAFKSRDDLVVRGDLYDMDRRAYVLAGEGVEGATFATAPQVQFGTALA